MVPRAQLAVGDRRAQGIGARPPRPDHEFSDAARRVKRAVRGLGRKPFVIMLVRHEYDVCAVLVQRLPVRLSLHLAAVRRAGAEAWEVPICERAARRMGREVSSEPLLL